MVSSRPALRRSECEVLTWLRLQGLGVRGRACVTYETRPCNLKAKLSLFSKQPASQEDNAEQDVNAVVCLAKV
jgi:hypothetical protein